MISAEKNNLPETAERNLREWLKKPPFEQLLKVIEAQGKIHAAEFSKTSIETKDFEGKQDAADALLKKAKRYATAVEVLREIAAKPDTEPFVTVKLT